MSDALQLGLLALDRTAAAHRADIDRLVPLARQLAAQSPTGITVADLRKAAGLLEGRGREFSYLGAVMKAAGLKATNEWRRSDLAVTHGNPARVWRMP